MRLAANHVATRRLERGTVAFPDGRVTRETAAMATLLGLDRPVRMLRGAEGTMPVSWGLVRATVLLPAGAERWHPSRLRAVLLHELAHVARHDCATQALADAAQALYWPNPLAWVAAWRLRVEREHACDDRVLEAGARASEYARELLSLARGFQAGPALSTAAVAMARPGRLASRLRAVLAEGRRRSLSRTAALAVTAGAVLLTGAASAATPAVAAPAAGPAETTAAASRTTPSAPAADQASGPAPLALPPQAMTCGMEATGWQSMSHHSDDGRERLQWSKPGCEVDVRVEGEVRFSDDFMDVASLGRNALFRIEENEGRTERRLDVTPGSGGDPTYEYRVDGRTEPFDAQARAWYQGMLLQVFRRGGYMAEERVAALLRTGGVDAVLQELDLIPSDYVSARYVEELMRQADLSEGQVVQLVDEARDRVDSDHYLAGILTALAENHDLTSPVMDAFLRASRSLDSDHYRAQVLTTALDKGTLQTGQVEALLASASEIDSDHYLAQILDSVAERYALNPSMRGAYLRAVESIESDHYRTQVLSGLLDRGDLDAGELSEVLRAAGSIESDHYVTEILRKASTRELSGPLQDAYLDVARGIESDHYKAEALTLLVRRDQVSSGLLAGVLDATSSIASDHYKAGLLVEIAQRHTLSGDLRDAYMRAMDSVGSKTYRGRVAEALLDQGGD